MSLLRLSSPALTAIALAPILLIAVMARTAGLPEPGVGAASAAAAIWALVFTMLAWRRLDEPAKEAHKFAWFWGGLGLVLLLAASVFTPLPALAREHIVDPFLAANPGSRLDPASYGFLTGVTAAALAQAAGWAIVWCAWWAARRR